MDFSTISVLQFFQSRFIELSIGPFENFKNPDLVVSCCSVGQSVVDGAESDASNDSPLPSPPPNALNGPVRLRQ